MAVPGSAVDPVARVARAEAGTRWQEVIDAAAQYGLAPLSGSSPQVGVVGYTTGGGLSPTMGRAHGGAADRVRAFEIVTADGLLIRATAERDSELTCRCGTGRSASTVSGAACFRRNARHCAGTADSARTADCADCADSAAST